MILRQQKLFTATLILSCIIFLGTWGSAEAQGGAVRLRLPFDGVRRITAYVDHRSPGAYDGNMVVYHGEERENCPGSGTAWTTQGPYCYDRHRGTDYALVLVPVLATAEGVVTLAQNQGGTIGNAVHIDHGNGYETRYYHLHSYSVAVNDTVSAGQQVGVSGNSGGQPYHLHFEVRYNGQVTDPFGWRGNWTDPIPGGPAECLWGDGQCSEIVIEDESAWFTKKLPGWQWYHQGYSWTMRYIGTMSSTPYPNWATWRPDLAYQGVYKVFAFVPAIHGTTTNARYVVHHVNGSNHETETVVSVNQSMYDDAWFDLGTYRFWDGLYGYVYLDNITGEPNGTKELSFDAIKFVQFRMFLPAIRE